MGLTRRARDSGRRMGGLIVGVGVCAVLVCGCDSGSGQSPATGTSAVTATTATTETTNPATPSQSAPIVTTSVQIYPAPFIDHVEWVQTEVGPSLQVYPTTSGRRTEEPGAGAAAWAEVITLDPGADTPGMKAQFDCHWEFARAVEPDKASWNLEPQRPVVTDEEMISTRCNPGGPEE